MKISSLKTKKDAKKLKQLCFHYINISNCQEIFSKERQSHIRCSKKECIICAQIEGHGMLNFAIVTAFGNLLP